MEVGAYSSSGKEHLSSNPRRRSQQEFESHPATPMNQKKSQEHKAHQYKVMKVGEAYNASGKDHLLPSNPRRRSLQAFDSRPTLNQKKDQQHNENQSKALVLNKSRPVWDCGSSLYDSVELDSFKRQLDSAISCRTMSMPHLSDRRVLPPPPSSFTASHNSLQQKTLVKQALSLNSEASQANIKDGFYVVYDKTGALTTIPEVVPHEFDFGGLSPEIGALVGRTTSERLTATSTSNIGISCA
ncbi:uncharacterized protein Pyn_30776 [Prunus yedoensis var. nudiflora]|uniref:Uncharacterized protein n=1 Tax=Prunus yedoensis var. nudiflora TaxID=2094558 RepID=A0A314UHH5_PRUYE|nr:uncharacterized protein Pyn_30776 [Prunus yedoensis var. nudiflora]